MTAATAMTTSGSTTGSGSTSSAATATSNNGAAGLTAPGVVSLVVVAGLMPLAWL